LIRLLTRRAKERSQTVRAAEIPERAAAWVRWSDSNSPPIDCMEEPKLVRSSALLFVEWTAPVLTMRVDLVPLEFLADSASILRLEIDAPDLKPSDLELVRRTVGFACNAIWPEESGAAELEIHLNWAFEPVVIHSPHVKVERAPCSPSDIEVKVRYLRQLAADHLADWWRESRELADLRSRLRQFVDRGIERSSRKLDFFTRSNSTLAQAMEARLRTLREVAVLLESKHARGNADDRNPR
jgi:hypothetical protein